MPSVRPMAGLITVGSLLVACGVTRAAAPAATQPAASIEGVANDPLAGKHWLGRAADLAESADLLALIAQTQARHDLPCDAALAKAQAALPFCNVHDRIAAQFAIAGAYAWTRRAIEAAEVIRQMEKYGAGAEQLGVADVYAGRNASALVRTVDLRSAARRKAYLYTLAAAFREVGRERDASAAIAQARDVAEGPQGVEATTAQIDLTDLALCSAQVAAGEVAEARRTADGVRSGALRARANVILGTALAARRDAAGVEACRQAVRSALASDEPVAAIWKAQLANDLADLDDLPGARAALAAAEDELRKLDDLAHDSSELAARVFWMIGMARARLGDGDGARAALEVLARADHAAAARLRRAQNDSDAAVLLARAGAFDAAWDVVRATAGIPHPAAINLAAKAAAEVAFQGVRAGRRAQVVTEVGRCADAQVQAAGWLGAARGAFPDDGGPPWRPPED